MMLMMLAPVACIISIIGAPFHQFRGIRLQPLCFSCVFYDGSWLAPGGVKLKMTTSGPNPCVPHRPPNALPGFADAPAAQRRCKSVRSLLVTQCNWSVTGFVQPALSCESIHTSESSLRNICEAAGTVVVSSDFFGTIIVSSVAQGRNPHSAGCVNPCVPHRPPNALPGFADAPAAQRRCKSVRSLLVTQCNWSVTGFVQPALSCESIHTSESSLRNICSPHPTPQSTVLAERRKQWYGIDERDMAAPPVSSIVLPCFFLTEQHAVVQRNRICRTGRCRA